MAIKYDMTWEPGPRRWRKQYKGRQYVVSCRRLGCPETPEASYQAALQWWAQRRAEIDQAIDPIVALYEVALANRRDMLEWMRRSGHRDPKLQNLVNREIRQLDRDMARDVPPPLPTTVDGHLMHPLPISPDHPEYDVWWYRVQSVRDARLGSSSSSTPTIATLIDKYLHDKQIKAEAGQIRMASYTADRDRLPEFGRHCGHLQASHITEQTLSDYHSHLLTKIVSDDYSVRYAYNLLAAAKTFVRHLWVNRMIENMPRNFSILKISLGQQEIPTYDMTMLKRVLGACTERTRLFLMLMMNIGAYQNDIASLRKSQIDMVAGRITRKRTKTERIATVPTVSYLLWDETFTLLKKHISSHPTLALTNEIGKPLLRMKAKGCRVDNIYLSYQRTCNKLKIKPIPLMWIRKTSATMLGNHDVYFRYVDMYLGHAPRTMAESRYARPSPVGFDQAIRWLGSQYGYGTR